MTSPCPRTCGPFRHEAALLTSALLVLLGFWLLTAYAWANSPNETLEPVSSPKVTEEISVDPTLFAEREKVLQSIVQTRAFLRSPAGQTKLGSFETKGLDAERLDRSLAIFSALLVVSDSPADLVRRLRDTFDLYRVTGRDGRGSVRFTGYFRPVYEASSVRSAEFPYPIFRAPPDFSAWRSPHPTRVALEGTDGRGGPGTLLHGYELAFLRSRFEAYMIQVQGGGLLEFADGRRQAIGYAAGTAYPFRGMSKAFLLRNKVAWTRLPDLFRTKPAEVNRELSLNNRFIFFKEQASAEPIGSLGLPVVAERSVAVDQVFLPPGAIGIVRTSLPERTARGTIRMVPTSRFVLNLDSGSAIKGPGRADIFMGTGDEARERANFINGDGNLYYLFSKP